MNRKWCTVAFWTESVKWLVFRLSSACLRSAHLVQLCWVLCDDLLIPLSFRQPFPGQSPSLFCLALTQPCAHICLSTKAVLPWNHLHFFPPWAKVNRGIIFCLEAIRTSRKWLRSLHSSSPSSSPQPISWEHNRGSGGHCHHPFQFRCAHSHRPLVQYTLISVEQSFVKIHSLWLF